MRSGNDPALAAARARSFQPELTPAAGSAPVTAPGTEAVTDDTELVILVDPGDREIGSARKLSVHRAGQLHRAFSVFVFDRRGQMLLQRRAQTKYHSGGLWSNACCGHPRPGEPTDAAARRRLREELGFECDVRHVGSVYYKLPVTDELSEHEFDHLFVAEFDGVVDPNAAEVDAIRWLPGDALARDLEQHPERYTAWLRFIVDRLGDDVLAAPHAGDASGRDRHA